jgi:hypothetical protein
MSYWRVGTKQDSLPYFVWADNAQHAIRKVQEFAGEALVNGCSIYQSAYVERETIPEGADVVDEPEDLKETREAEYE